MDDSSLISDKFDEGLVVESSVENGATIIGKSGVRSIGHGMTYFLRAEDIQIQGFAASHGREDGFYLKKAPLTTALTPPVQMTLILTWPEILHPR